MIQKMLIRKCVRRQKPVIVATQMLESMIKNPRPTRAEVSDVANAVLDGTSALMLSGESANGDYPLEAVTTLSTIAIELEAKKFDFKQSQMEHKAEDVRMLLSKAAISACADLGAKAIICPTVTGKTPRCVSSFRAKWPIYAQCYDPLVMRRLALSYGVFPSLMSQQKTTDQLVSTGIKQLVDAGDLSIEDQVVILARTPGHDEEATNFMEVTTVKHALDNYKD
jgi:pyruvate kinase